MTEIKLSLKSVGDIKGMRFLIPNYQRGYRWEADQVTALLDDLAEFEARNEPSAERFYCLQPLVVVKRLVEWEVVDGQQRITTLYLIQKHLSPTEAPFDVRYERHPAHRDGLKGLLEAIAEGLLDRRFMSPDLHFLKKAQEAIENWFKEHKDSKLTVLSNGTGPCAKFIWHEVEPGPEAIGAFTRLNAGKIRLKDSELIRALFLRAGTLDQDDQHRIALQWDQMERRFQDPEFWSFLAAEGDDTDNRIELLFRLIAMKKGWDYAKSRTVFNHVNAELAQGDVQRNRLWWDAEDLFGTLDEWFENNRLFHLIGFLVVTQRRSVVAELLKLSPKLDKSAFLQHLKRRIRIELLGEVASPDGLGDYLGNIEYGNPGIRELLLCLNLATLNADETNTVRFSFHSYRSEKGWDVEHIRATASRPPDGVKELRQAMEMILDYWDKRPGNERPHDLEQARKALEQHQENPETLSGLYKSLCNEMEKDRELEMDDRLKNLTLLDCSTNRGYGNSPFAVKRAWILHPDRQARYLLPCTRNVFTKSYSQAPCGLLHWTEDDAAHYLTAIESTLKDFFAGTWEDKQ